MPERMSKKRLTLITTMSLVIVAIIAATILIYITRNNSPTPVVPTQSTSTKPQPTEQPAAQPPEAYQGVSTVIANSFSIKVPNGWRASVSHSPSFTAIIFAQPNQIDSLTYDERNAPVIDYNGIALWSGLTEHFFVIMPTVAQAFNPSDHLEVSSQAFTFNDGTVGQSYYVVKHAAEAQKWGGLQKDTEWQGRTYIYEKDGKKVEAHLAVYPSTGISIAFYEEVVKTLKL